MISRRHLLHAAIGTIGFCTSMSFAQADAHIYVGDGGMRFVVSADAVSIGTSGSNGIRYEQGHLNGGLNRVYRRANTTSVLALPESFVSGSANGGEVIIHSGFSKQIYKVVLLAESAIRNFDLISEEGVVFRFTGMGVIVSGLSSSPDYLQLQVTDDAQYRLYKFQHSNFFVKAPVAFVEGRATAGLIEVSNGFYTKTYTVDLCKNLLRR